MASRLGIVCVDGEVGECGGGVGHDIDVVEIGIFGFYQHEKVNIGQPIPRITGGGLFCSSWTLWRCLVNWSSMS